MIKQPKQNKVINEKKCDTHTCKLKKTMYTIITLTLLQLGTQLEMENIKSHGNCIPISV